MDDVEPGIYDGHSGHGNAIHGGVAQSLDDQWVLIQLNTFTNWVKDQLTNHDVTVDDLRSDFCDGTRLCALMEMLQHRRIPHVVKKPINQHQCLDNINLALKAMTNDGIKLVNIGAEDIHSGNLKLILGMVWRLILRYQIGRGKTPPKKLMLAWINAVVPGQSVTNFNTDWNDGIALHGVVEYCRPGTSPKWNQLSRREGLWNCQSAMEAAKMHFGIPMVLKPENLSSHDLDELSGMTYLSYFMKVNSPGYSATLKWVQQQIPHMNVKNFQSDWNDGKVLLALVESLGGVIVGGVEHGTSVDFLQRAMNAAKVLGVDPVISAKEMGDPDVDHLGVMAYAARLQAVAPKKNLNHKNSPAPKAVNHRPAEVHPPPPAKEPTKERGLPPAERLKVMTPSQAAYTNRRCSFSLESQDNQINKGQVKVSVTGPSTRPPVTLKWKGQSGVCEFVPVESGIHKVFVYNEENLVKGCPMVINVSNDASQMRLVSSVSNATVGRPVSFKINPGGAHKATIHALARSPGGHTSSLEVVERDGMYVANFTPSETGDWQISLLCEDQHIQGSPFSVQVSDPNLVHVSDIEKGIAGKSTNFSVQTSGAGTGQLTVDITHNGRPVQAQIIPEGHGTYRIHFTPVGVGTYVIRVYFAGIETEGSPFTIEVVDAGSVVATGEGLASAEVNRRSTFCLNLGHNGTAADVKAQVISPRGSTYPATIVDTENGNVVLGYVPTEVGEHRIDVFYCGKPVKGSPFRANVYDWSKINVVNLPGKGIAGSPVEFEIDASQAGSGNLEITVNNGSVPCDVQKQNGQRFLASFVPHDSIPHLIRMKFNDRDVPGSPWKVDVHNPANVSINSSSIEFIPVGKLAEFEVRVSGGSSDGDLGVNISSPSSRVIRANVINMRNGLYRVEFVPIEVGSHTINVAYDGTSVHGTPLISRVYNASAIAVTPVNAGIVGLPVEFSIDVSQAGEGHLEIMVNKGTVPNVVQMVTKGIYRVSFTPLEPRPYTVDIRFNKEPLPQGAITVPIMDTGRSVISRADETNLAAANRQSFFQLRNTQSLMEKDLTVRVTSPSGELVPAKIVMQVDGDYKVEYSSKFTGRHTVEILHNGEAIMGSPFYVEIYDPNKIRVEGCRTGEVGERMEFDVICREAGKAKLKVNITGPRGNSVPFEMYSTPVGEHVRYVPRDPGIYEITITYGGLDVPGCPIRQEIVNTGLIVAEGEGLSRGVEDQVATFWVDSKGQRGDLVVQVDGPNSISKCNIETEIGRYTVNYVPVEVGVFNIKITWNGREIDGSPFHPRIVNPRKVQPVGGWESIVGARNRISLKLNETNTLEFDTRQAGPGQLSAEVIGPGGKIPVDIISKERGKTAVSFVPKAEGEYQVRLNWNGVELEKSPVYGTCLYSSSSPSNPVLRSALATNAHQSAIHQVNNHVSISNTRTTHSSTVDGHLAAVNLDRVVLTGMGLQHARVNQQAEFCIDGTQAGPGMPSVRLTGLKGDLLVNCVPLSDNKYRCTYTAPVSGAYLLYISWSDRQVSGSPYKVTVQPSSDASKVICSTEGLNSGMSGRDIKATLDVRKAGPGEPVVQCHGPTKADFCQLIDNYDGTFTLVIRPQEPGRHTLQIKYGNEHIQGSPFILNVAGIADASKVQVHGPGVMDGILAVYQSHFIVDTHGAGAGELTVKIRGPRGGFRVEMQRQSQKDRTIFCRYDPTEVGEYLIDIRWSGDSVPGSPFIAHIFDSQDELRRFQAEVTQHGFNSNYHTVMSGPWPDEFD